MQKTLILFVACIFFLSAFIGCASKDNSNKFYKQQELDKRINKSMKELDKEIKNY